MSSGRKISLRSSDRESFEVDEAVALESQTIKQMIEDDCADNGIPLPNVTSKILAKVIEYCKKHVETPKLEDRGTNSGDYELQIWDYEFVKVDQATLFDLFMAASYLNIKGLLDLTGYAIADMIKRKTPEEIRKTFNCKGKLTPEEEEEVRRENQWPPWETDADMTPEAIRKTSNIKGKTPFNINDLTPEEEEEVRRENQWAFQTASNIKGKTPFNIKNDFTPEEEEEEEEVRRENQWACKTVADMIKVKTPEEIRKTSNIKGKTPFNIKNDFTPEEEEEEVRRENQWACQSVADMIKVKTPEAIRKTSNIKGKTPV